LQEVRFFNNMPRFHCFPNLRKVSLVFCHTGHFSVKRLLRSCPRLESFMISIRNEEQLSPGGGGITPRLVQNLLLAFNHSLERLTLDFRGWKPRDAEPDKDPYPLDHTLARHPYLQHLTVDRRCMSSAGDIELDILPESLRSLTILRQIEGKYTLPDPHWNTFEEQLDSRRIQDRFARHPSLGRVTVTSLIHQLYNWDLEVNGDPKLEDELVPDIEVYRRREF
jgi:hypothetical protein